ncbi:MAG: heavy-metal-associated domain-containing protein [Cytophagales bacterium]|nr:heavy-metal-associated domain-containing protein [Cytophagales bacterium]
MKTLKFKTNINCSGCVAKATSVLNELEGVEEWIVNTNDPNKILEVKTNNLNSSDIIQKLVNIGFKAEKC